MTFHNVLTSLVGWRLNFLAGSFLILVGLFDVVTGWEVSVLVFYAVPVFLVAWYGNRNTGYTIAILGGCVWWWANRYGNPYATEWGYGLAAFSRLAYFLFVSVGTAALRANKDADAARIEALERTQELETEIVRVSEHEQQRIGRDLHDGLCQHLAAIGFAANSLADDLEKRLPEEAENAREIEQLLKDAVVQARDLARGIFPVQMDDAGLSAALDELAKTSGRYSKIAITFKEEGEPRMPSASVAMHLYRIAQEALSNALRHSRANHILIILGQTENTITLTVEDDGHGLQIDPESCQGMGLRTMRYRSHLLDADLKIEAGKSGGTLITCTLSIPSTFKNKLT